MKTKMIDSRKLVGISLFAGALLIAGCDLDEGGGTPMGEFTTDFNNSDDDAYESPQGQSIASPENVAVVPFEPSFGIYNQVSPQGDEVIVSNVSVPQSAFIAIYEDAFGAPGPVVGSLFVDAGHSYQLKIELSRQFEHNETLWATLHADNGERGVFEPAVDGVLFSEFGMLMRRFVNYTHNPVSEFVFAQDQWLEEGADRVEVPVAVSDGDGWMVIYEDANCGWGDVVGVAPVQSMWCAGIVVQLDRPVVDGERFWAVLHDDGGIIGEWEPSIDTPSLDLSDELSEESFTIYVE